jgi:hypothetical protein
MKPREKLLLPKSPNIRQHNKVLIGRRELPAGRVRRRSRCGAHLGAGGGRAAGIGGEVWENRLTFKVLCLQYY